MHVELRLDASQQEGPEEELAAVGRAGEGERANELGDDAGEFILVIDIVLLVPGSGGLRADVGTCGVRGQGAAGLVAFPNGAAPGKKRACMWSAPRLWASVLSQ